MRKKEAFTVGRENRVYQGALPFQTDCAMDMPIPSMDSQPRVYALPGEFSAWITFVASVLRAG